MLAGVIYWAVWRVVLPKVFGYELVPRKETLEDASPMDGTAPQKIGQNPIVLSVFLRRSSGRLLGTVTQRYYNTRKVHLPEMSS
ncbi:hypothetical protein JR316_0008648 [Psilocybe cubensis]|uniref:Uncharacterized protein n=1 Tax=Psilocybe cubensis TaxID=181762 RepID=A0ACB8GR41_PSICU|nr:hypothetical protein JR316_0008648 [Psilocybe cubensis]KAH9478195.1 hypothetical protein JR316_0008648 [Psilocybe cubensis]